MANNNNQIIVPDYPSNTKQPKRDENDIHVIEKVITGNATTRKRGLWYRFIDTFIGDDIQNIRTYILYDMIIPGIKEGILGGIEMMFFGTTRPRGRGSSRRANVDRASYNQVNYGSYSKGSRQDRRDYVDNQYPSMDDVMFETRGDAELVLDALRADIARYNEATESAYYQYAGVSNNDYTANDRGWTNLDMNIRPRRIRGGKYVLDLPKPDQLV